MGTLIKADYNHCLGMTNHEVVGKKQIVHQDEGMVEANSYEIIACQGCDTVRFRQVTRGSEITDEEGKHRSDHILSSGSLAAEAALVAQR